MTARNLIDFMSLDESSYGTWDDDEWDDDAWDDHGWDEGNAMFDVNDTAEFDAYMGRIITMLKDEAPDSPLIDLDGKLHPSHAGDLPKRGEAGLKMRWLNDGSLWFEDRRHRLYNSDGWFYAQFNTPQEIEAFVDKHGFDGSGFDRSVFSGSYTHGPEIPEDVPLDERLNNEVFRHGGFAVIDMPPDPVPMTWEGRRMGHCLGSYYTSEDYCRRISNGEIKVYSLTSLDDGDPWVNIEVALKKSSYFNANLPEPTVTQIRGRGNQVPPDDRFIPALWEFFKTKPEWRLTGHGVPNFDGRVDGDLFVAKAQELGLT